MKLLVELFISGTWFFITGISFMIALVILGPWIVIRLRALKAINEEDK